MSLKEISHLRGLDGPLLFAVDNESELGKSICHFVRFETIAFENGEVFKSTVFRTISEADDPRLRVLAQCFNPPGGSSNG